MSRAGRIAVFLDRDDTINRDTGYVGSPDEVELLPGAGAAVARLNAAGLLVVVVSNQSGVARGFFSEAEVQAVNAELSRQLAPLGAKVDHYYYCPHYPQAKVPQYKMVCNCRKPAPGMLLAAAQELGLDLAGSFMVGDKGSDVAAGRAAGTLTIKIGSGPDQSPPSGPQEEPHHQTPDLAGAVDWILTQLKGQGGA